MTLEQFFNLVATIFGTIGSVYVLLSFLQLTPKMTERLAAGRYGHNTELIDSLSAQKAESVVGASLIVIALVIAIVNAVAMPSNIIIYQDRLYAIPISIILAVLTFLILRLARNIVDSHHRLETARIIVGKTLDSLFKDKSASNSDIKSLYYLNDKYLHLQVTPDTTPRDFLRLLAKNTGRVLPDNVRIDGESS